MTTLSRILLVVTLATCASVPVARAQLGTGGSTGVGTLQSTDFFIAVQKQRDVNLNERDRLRFLNRANCQCETPAFIRAVILPSALARAATIPASATVSMYMGNSCSSPTENFLCRKLASGIPFSQFRQTGITADTNVQEIAKVWGRITDVNAGTGGATGSGGAGGTGGAGGIGGAGGSGGAGGTGGNNGTGGATTTTTGGVCDSMNTQTIWLFIGTTGDLSTQLVSVTQGFAVDSLPPAELENVNLQPANQALLVSWTGLLTTAEPDLLGYQVLCARGGTETVFNPGAFTAGFDRGCPGDTLLQLDPSFVCSDLLSTASTSYRLKILENDITYAVGVVAVDRQGNASRITMPKTSQPVLTRDFYYDYRHGEMQGSDSGGFCSVGGGATAGAATIAGGLAALGGLALTLFRRRPSRRRR